MSSGRYHRHEAGVETGVGRLYSTIGAHVNKNSAAVWAKGVSAGPADLYIQHTDWGLTWHHEAKVGRYRQTKVQWEFMEREKACGGLYVLGDSDAAIDFLVWLGIGTKVTDTIQFELPRSLWPAYVGQRLAERDAIYDGIWSWYESAAFHHHFERFGYREPIKRQRSYRPR